jgi:hypothetical protein
MPGLARKLLIFAAVDGLVLQPLAQRNQPTPPAVQIAYDTHSISTLRVSHNNERLQEKSFESHGIIGVLYTSFYEGGADSNVVQAFL